KFVPVIVTEVPTSPEVTDRFVLLGAGTTVKLTPLLAAPATVTTTFPVVAPDGTGAPMANELQLVGVVGAPLNVIVLEPWLDPKFVPVIVTAAPTAPVAGDSPLLPGRTVKEMPLLATPLTLTTTFPVAAPLGTVTPILDAPHDVTLAVAPLNVTVPVPCELPKFEPVTVTVAPTAPDVTDKLVMLGAGTCPFGKPVWGEPGASVLAARS